MSRAAELQPASRSPFWRDACVLGGAEEPTADYSGQELSDVTAPKLAAAVRSGARRVLLRHARLPGATAALVSRALLPTGASCRVSRVDLSGAHVDASQLRAVLTALRTNSTVTALSLEGVGTADEDGLLPILLRSGTCTLRHVIAADNSFGAEWGELLGAALKENSCLRTLDLRNNTLGSAGTAAVLDGVMKHPQLTALSLAANGMGSPAAPLLGELVQKNRSLRSLSLDDSDLSGMDAIGPLCRQIGAGQAPHLRELGLNRCGLGGEAARALAAALRAQHQRGDEGLWALSVAGNDIGDEALAELMALPSAGQLRFLSTSDCGGGPLSAAQIPALVEDSAEIRCLDAGGAPVDCVTLHDVINRGSCSAGLRALSLRRATGVGDSGIATLGSALRNMTGLEALVLDETGIRSEGFGNLCSYLCGPQSTTRLVQLDVSRNQVAATPRVLDGLTGLFKRQPCLAAVRAVGTPLAMHFQTPELTREVVTEKLKCDPLPAAQRMRSSAFLPRGADVPRWPGDPRGLVTYRPTALFFGSSGCEDPEDDAATRPSVPRPRLQRSDSWHRRYLHEHAETIKNLPDDLDVRLDKKYVVREEQLGGGSGAVDDDVGLRVRGAAGRLDRRRVQQAQAVGGIVLTEEHMRKLFQRLDTSGDGVVDVDEFSAFVTEASEWDPTWSPDKISKVCAQTGVLDDGIVEFEEFCLLLLMLNNM